MSDAEYGTVMEECRRNCEGIGTKCGVQRMVAEGDGIWLGCERSNEV